MAKDKITVTVDPAVICAADADAADAGLNRSQWVEAALRDAHYRRILAAAEPAPLPGADADGLRDLLTWQARAGRAA